MRDLHPIRVRLETIETSQELRELRRAVLQVPSLEAFRQILDSNRTHKQRRVAKTASARSDWEKKKKGAV